MNLNPKKQNSGIAILEIAQMVAHIVGLGMVRNADHTEEAVPINMHTTFV